MAPWIAPLGDTDCDSWTDGQEYTIGTDFRDHCPDRQNDDAYPADFDRNRIVNVFDILTGIGPVVGKTANDQRWVSSGGQRADLDVNNIVNVFDILRMSAHIGYICT